MKTEDTEVLGKQRAKASKIKAWYSRPTCKNHWPLIGGLLHLVQRRGDWVGPQPAQAPPHCTRCNSPPINDHCTNHRVMAHCSAVLMCLCRVKPLVFSVCLITCLWCVLLCTAVMTSEKKFPCGITSRPHAMQCTGVVMLVLFCSATATAELNLPYYVCVEQLLKSISRKHGDNSNQHQRQVTNSDK